MASEESHFGFLVRSIWKLALVSAFSELMQSWLLKRSVKVGPGKEDKSLHGCR